MQPLTTGILCSTGNVSLATTASATLPPISAVQPCADVAKALRERKPQPDPQLELPLLITLPAKVQAEVAALKLACQQVLRRISGPGRVSIVKAIAAVLPTYKHWNWHPKSFRTKFDAYVKQRDWLVLVNRSQCKGGWKETNAGLPVAFLQYCAMEFGKFRRIDAKRQAVQSIKRQWRTGRDDSGKPVIIPGYETGWDQRTREKFPAGWHYSNILRQIRKSGAFTSAVRALLHEGIAAATEHLPHHLSTREGLRFLERIMFDDVRLDFLVWNPDTRKAEECWLLIARDQATTMILGFVMHLATVRADGTATHLGAKEMKQLAGWLLERYPLPPYVMHWVVECGTATLSDSVAAALGELLGNRVMVHFTSMIGGKSPVGYKEKAKGNSRGKASLESLNRPLHTAASSLPAQTGAHYGIRPADLQARVEEAEQIWALRDQLPEELRGKLEIPVLTSAQARIQIARLCHEQNTRFEHEIEGFEEVLEWWDGHNWQPQATCNDAKADRRKRLERPTERATKLLVGHEWTPASPAVVAAFYAHTEKYVYVETNGEIQFKHEGKLLYFEHAGVPLTPGVRVLAYFHPDDPRYLHLTDGRGCVLGTWIKRNRTPYFNDELLANAMRYTATAKAIAKEAAATLAAPQVAELEAMRANNAELIKTADFTDITEAPASGPGLVGSPVGAALVKVAEDALQDRTRERKQRAAETAAAAEDALRATESNPHAAAAVSDFLSALGGQSAPK